MSGCGERVFHDILPCDDIEGRAAAVLGRFVEFVERIIAAVGLLQQKCSLDDWAETLGGLLRDFFQPSEDAALELQTIRDQLTRLRRHQALSGFDQPIELAAVLERLVPALEQDIHNSGFLTGGVTFCGLKPMRSIPFKVVCLVGMNDGAFPRPTQHLSFDLMAAKPRLGDRSTREDDRYLFLETLLSARDRLHLSYVGQSIRDNSEAPPSVLLSELMDCIAQGFGLEQTEDGGGVLSRILVRHRLQAFSEEYFKLQGRLFSYSQENCHASAAVRSARATPAVFVQKLLAEPEAEFRELTLDDLASFMGNPARFFSRAACAFNCPMKPRSFPSANRSRWTPSPTISSGRNFSDAALPNKTLTTFDFWPWPVDAFRSVPSVRLTINALPLGWNSSINASPRFFPRNPRRRSTSISTLNHFI